MRIRSFFGGAGIIILSADDPQPSINPQSLNSRRPEHLGRLPPTTTSSHPFLALALALTLTPLSSIINHTSSNHTVHDIIHQTHQPAMAREPIPYHNHTYRTYPSWGDSSHPVKTPFAAASQPASD